MKSIIIYICLILLALSVGCYGQVDFSSPERTVAMWYLGFDEGDKELIRKTFLKPELKKIHTSNDYKIDYKTISIDTLTKDNYDEISPKALPDDVEIVTEETYFKLNTEISSNKTPKSQKWFLLRKVENKWKIVEYSMIAVDEPDDVF